VLQEINEIILSPKNNHVLKSYIVTILCLKPVLYKVLNRSLNMSSKFHFKPKLKVQFWQSCFSSSGTLWKFGEHLWKCYLLSKWRSVKLRNNSV